MVTATGLIGASIYALYFMQRGFFGPAATQRDVRDLGALESIMYLALAAGLIALGLLPQPVFELAAPALAGIEPGVLTRQQP